MNNLNAPDASSTAPVAPARLDAPKGTSASPPADVSADTPPASSAPDAPAVAWLRLHYTDRQADDLAEVLRRLDLPTPAFLDRMPGPDADESELTDADRALSTDLWPRGDAAADLLGGLHALFSSEGSAAFGWAGAETFAETWYRNPRVALVHPDYVSGTFLHQLRALRGWERAEIPADSAAYVCTFTHEPFLLQTTAPVPCVVFDVDTSSENPADRTYPQPIHPALVEAGPSRVLWAVWHWAESEVYQLSERLHRLGSLASTFAGMEPGDLGTEWPAAAYRFWGRARGQTEGYSAVPLADFRDPQGGPKRNRKAA